MTIERDELLRLLRRDHRELEMGLLELVSPDLGAAQRRQILDGVRLGLEAHGAAEDIVVYPAFARIATSSGLQCLIEQARTAHGELDDMFARLLATPMTSSDWSERVHMLRLRAEALAAREENDLIPQLRTALAPELYRSLAGAFATERLRQLSMLQPSAPIAMPLEMMSR
jgi:Hemerythrin HHE cation binding domain